MSDGTILIADDTVVTRKILAAIVERAGYAVLEAADGSQALHLVRARHPDLVLLDIRMPGKDGFEVCAALKADPATEDIPVIFISSLAGVADRIHGLELGGADYITQPFDAGEVVARMRTQLKLSSLSRTLLRVNQELHRQLSLSEALTDSLGEGVYALDREGLLTFLNRAGERALGYTEAELIGRNMHDHIHSRRADGAPSPAAECPLLEVIRSRRTFHSEDDVFVRKDGSLFPVSYTSSPIVLAGQVTGAVLAFRDITERKRAEKFQARLVSILETIPDFVGTADLQRKPIFLNRAGRRMIGLTEGADLATTTLPPLYPPWAAALVSDVAIPTAMREGVWAGETAIVTPGGQELPVSQVVIVHRDERGQPEFISTIMRDISERKHAEETLREQVIRDPLTSLFNRRYMTEALRSELARAARSGGPVAVIMIDLDHFKRVNDSHGHEAGDTLLRVLGEVLRNNCRMEDIACRYGGEEFTLILPGAQAEHACARAEQLRQEVERLRVPVRDAVLTLTVSAGVAAYPLHGSSVDDLLRAADSALYEAKSAGRNVVVSASLAHDSEPTPKP